MESAFFDPRRHEAALLQLSRIGLENGDFSAALRFADRSCRVFGKNLRNLVSRSKALRGLGHRKSADADLADALEIDPFNPEANEELLLFGRQDQSLHAAEQLLTCGAASEPLLRQAVRRLREAGRRCVLRHHIVDRRGLCGWAVWDGPTGLTIEIDTERATERFVVSGETSHRYAAYGAAADFDVAVESGPIREARFVARGVALARIDCCAAAAAGVLPATGGAKASHVQVIVPVYRDFDVTKVCLNSLSRQSASFEIQVLLVDDCGPEPRLSAYLEAFARETGAVLVRNARNLGFVGSANEALKLYSGGDVLLLNADTVLPAGAIERLSGAVHASEDIGTATPFSNNGEFVSFPRPFIYNPLPSVDSIAAVDALFAACNRDIRVPLPCGVGFCLFVKAACLQKVGPLSVRYAPGYGEDAEFSLAAREKGFISVCAADVYVGHAGGRSFGAEKRRWVVRNLKVLEQRFPSHRAECAAFLHADPLKEARARVEEALRAPSEAVLVVLTSERARAAADERVRQIHAEDPDLCVLQGRRAADGGLFDIRAAGDAAPQSLSFDLHAHDGWRRAVAYLNGLQLARVEVVDPAALTMEWAVVLAEIGGEMDIFASDATPFRAPPAASSLACERPQSPAPCARCTNAAAHFDAVREQATGLKPAFRLLSDQSRVWCADSMSEAIARRTYKNCEIVKARLADRSALPFRSPGGRQPTLGVLLPTKSAEVERLILAVQRRLLAVSPDLALIVLGACLNDMRILAGGNAFVSGPAEAAEYPGLLERYEIDHILCPYRCDHFWLFNRIGDAAGVRRSYFDWTFGGVARDPGDLAMDPRICDAKAAERVAQWMIAADGSEER